MYLGHLKINVCFCYGSILQRRSLLLSQFLQYPPGPQGVAGFMIFDKVFTHLLSWWQFWSDTVNMWNWAEVVEFHLCESFITAKNLNKLPKIDHWGPLQWVYIVYDMLTSDFYGKDSIIINFLRFDIDPTRYVFREIDVFW